MTKLLSIRTHFHLFSLLAALAAGPLASQAATTNYYTGFETSDGFTAGGAVWDNTSPWVTYMLSVNTNGSFGYGGNTILADHFPGMGQQASIGQSPIGTDPFGAPWVVLYLWPIDLQFDPVAVGRPIVKFSTTMTIEDSSNLLYDDFYWEAYNTNGSRLFSLDFYNGNNNIYYIPGTNANTYINTGARYTNGVIYNLVITMDFASNVWSAALNGTQILAPVPMARTGITRTFGEMDAIWDCYYNLSNSGAAGNNYMVFDNYLLTSEAATQPPPSRPSLRVLSATSGGPTTLRLTGQNGYKFAIDARTNLSSAGSWTPLGTNTVSSGFFDYVDSQAAGLQGCSYRARWVP
jgi:hypothetical protein